MSAKISKRNCRRTKELSRSCKEVEVGKDWVKKKTENFRGS